MKIVGLLKYGLLLFISGLLLSNADDLRSDSLPDNTMVVAMSTLHEETFLPWLGGGGRKFYLDTMYEYLTYVDPQTHELLPGLATQWVLSEDGKLWTITLRKGIEFQQGWGEMTAEDVKYSLERFIDPMSQPGPSSSMRNIIDKIVVTSRYKLDIYLKNPDISFVQGYLSNAMQMMIVSKRHIESDEEKAKKNPVGTGSFQLDSFKRGVSLTMEKTQGKHWRVTPDFQRIKFIAVPEESTRVAMLLTGEVDLAPINFDSIPLLREKNIPITSLKNSWSPIIRFGGLVKTSSKYYNAKVPWQDKRVRQAMNYAVNKEAILQAIFHGEGRIAGTDFPAEVFFDIAPYPYDPQKAKRLLTEAGYPDGFEVTLKTFTTTPGAELPIIGEIVAMDWQAVGIKVRIVPIDWISLRSAQVNGQVTGFVWTHRGIAFPNPLVGLQASYSPDSLFATYATEEITQRLSEIENSLQPEERNQRMKALGALIREEATGLFLLFSNEPYGRSSRVGYWPALSQHVTNIDLIQRRSVEP
ncbi:MAG: ABC transporter substrate-binding protein [Spongiibacteraceae bacterium]|nr:ABC transporter substrate-binding protein [Spongiibacteraceae bacterium]